MLAMGFSINNFTMLGLILAVGIVVDDAVVVHENIFRHMEERGLPARKAASTATSEIALAVVATTLSLVVVFAPIAFMGGQVGRFLSCFGWVVGFSVLMSLFVSFTMTPMLCSRFLKAEDGHNTSKSGLIWRGIEAVTPPAGPGRCGIAGPWSCWRWSCCSRRRFSLASSARTSCRATTQSEFEVAITLPEGYSLARADQVFSAIEQRVRGVRGVTATFVVIGDTTGRIAKGQGDVTRGTIYCRMTDVGARKFTQFDAMADARAVLERLPRPADGGAGTSRPSSRPAP